MTRDVERIERLKQGLREASLEALVCTLPQNVLLLSGYWPVLGLSVGIVTRDGRVVVLAPTDEEELAKGGWADEVQTFAAASLRELRPSADAVRQALARAAEGMGLGRNTTVGYENDEDSVPVPYAGLHWFGALLPELLGSAMPGVRLRGAGDLLQGQRAVLTPGELGRVRVACEAARAAFLEGAASIRAGALEAEVANAFRLPLSVSAKQTNPPERAGGWTWCMSGPNSARAYAAFARTRNRRIAGGDLAMVHCNSYADGYWTDITRTFTAGAPDQRQRALQEAVFAAYHAALEAIRPGAGAAGVDQAARQVMKAHGFEKEFKHPTGHGAGFAAISHNARPRLHPVSPDILETGMVFNVEPAVYIEGYGGVRHCSMVAVTQSGAEILTSFQETPESLVAGS